jgi:hypothetical protein
MSNFKGQLHVRLGEKVTIENLQEIVAQVAKLSGCPACGILGFDLRLSGDPVEAGQLAKLHGVKSIDFGG